MAVDANVLVFERIREEIRLGRTIKAAVHAGFDKAFTTIFDSNVTTLIAALALLGFGTGPVKGFAVTLSVGIAANLLTAVFMSRALFDSLLTANPRMQRLSI
jgi:protein-export membrane protein SecD